MKKTITKLVHKNKEGKTLALVSQREIDDNKLRKHNNKKTNIEDQTHFYTYLDEHERRTLRENRKGKGVKSHVHTRRKDGSVRPVLAYPDIIGSIKRTLGKMSKKAETRPEEKKAKEIKKTELIKLKAREANNKTQLFRRGYIEVKHSQQYKIPPRPGVLNKSHPVLTQKRLLPLHFPITPFNDGGGINRQKIFDKIRVGDHVKVVALIRSHIDNTAHLAVVKTKGKNGAKSKLTLMETYRLDPGDIFYSLHPDGGEAHPYFSDSPIYYQIMKFFKESGLEKQWNVPSVNDFNTGSHYLTNRAYGVVLPEFGKSTMRGGLIHAIEGTTGMTRAQIKHVKSMIDNVKLSNSYKNAEEIIPSAPIEDTVVTTVPLDAKFLEQYKV